MSGPLPLANHYTPLSTVVNPSLSQSATLLATPAIPPAFCTASSHCRCSGLSLPVALLTSMLVNTATCCPTISGVMVRVVQPIKSALPLHNPNCTGRPLRSTNVPVLLRNSLVLPLLHARRICCWMVCSDGKRHRHPPFHISVSATSVHDLLLPNYAQTRTVMVHLEAANRKVHGFFHAEQVGAVARWNKLFHQ